MLKLPRLELSWTEFCSNVNKKMGYNLYKNKQSKIICSNINSFREAKELLCNRFVFFHLFLRSTYLPFPIWLLFFYSLFKSHIFFIERIQQSIVFTLHYPIFRKEILWKCFQPFNGFIILCESFLLFLQFSWLFADDFSDFPDLFFEKIVSLASFD